MIAGEFDLSARLGLRPGPDGDRRRHGPLGHRSGARDHVGSGERTAGRGTLNVTLTFGIPSFVTTLGMLFIVRSLATSGGFPPPFPSDMPWLFSLPILGLFRSSMLMASWP